MPKNLRRRGKTWWYRFTYRGQTFEGSLETSLAGEAGTRAELKRKELIATNWGRKPKRRFDEAVIKFSAEHMITLKESSKARYVVSIANLEPVFAGMMLSDITSSKLLDFENIRRAKGVSTSTIRRDLACLSSIFSSC